MRKYCFCICLFVLSGKVYAQTEPLTSRLYFPASIGTDFHLYDKFQRYHPGLAINSAIEYRPDGNRFFYRLNYDAINSKYNSSTVNYLPTNVQYGTLHVSYLIAGIGYRKKAKITGWYLLVQPGLEQGNYDKIVITKGNYGIGQVSKKTLGVKLSGGFEYYLASHFALVAEPAYYPNTMIRRQQIPNGSFSLNIGFTTTLF